jgi:hypothetical protein
MLKGNHGIVLPEVTPLEADLSYPEHPIKILDQKDRVTRHKIEVLQDTVEQPL